LLCSSSELESICIFRAGGNTNVLPMVEAVAYNTKETKERVSKWGKQYYVTIYHPSLYLRLTISVSMAMLEGRIE
jgi:hypothetical protein